MSPLRAKASNRPERDHAGEPCAEKENAASSSLRSKRSVGSRSFWADAGTSNIAIPPSVSSAGSTAGRRAGANARPETAAGDGWARRGRREPGGGRPRQGAILAPRPGASGSAWDGPFLRLLHAYTTAVAAGRAEHRRRRRYNTAVE